MKNLLVLLSFLLVLSSCDDGDVILIEMDFDDSFEACGELVFYNIRETPFESISLKIGNPPITLDNIFEVEPNETNSYLVELVESEFEGTINGSTNLLNYRSYNSSASNLFCSDIPPSDLQITQDLSSVSGTYTILNTLMEDDDDGIPAEMEDINGNGNLYDDDTDGDGIPNFLDEDDDGDNVLTKTELLDYDDTDDDDNPLTDPKDTDGDGIPNYLDNDDDGDGILTINEDVNQDLNPANDYTNPNLPDYLNPDVAVETPISAYRVHKIKQTFEVSLTVRDISFPTLNQDFFDFGYLNNSKTSGTRSVTPEF
ncbi:hypothetical protein OS188_06895 [Xanthomarina sp. F1114]|uniref:hypothetical protein n=1 Tax=Xanthomarina sp. F1114 TaxID=2996019 RepID=UPI00225E0A53|nr:hypothetical protein [Xanthomarina sp. F1114]MCX7547674.1 hypothetical protein [Xanthomarina sp. F1114]